MVIACSCVSPRGKPSCGHGDWTQDFSAIADAATRLEDCILDGEVVALDHDGAPDFAALQAALSEGRSQDLTYFVFDLLPAGGEDLRRLPLTARKERLQSLLKRNGRATQRIKFVEHLAEPGDAVLQSACRLNLEGTISKCATAPYQSGRTDTWVKAKCRGGQEVVVGGWSGSSRNLRSLLVGVYGGEHLVHTGRVGTGFNQRNSGLQQLDQSLEERANITARELAASLTQLEETERRFRLLVESSRTTRSICSIRAVTSSTGIRERPSPKVGTVRRIRKMTLHHHPAGVATRQRFCPRVFARPRPEADTG